MHCHCCSEIDYQKDCKILTKYVSCLLVMVIKSTYYALTFVISRDVPGSTEAENFSVPLRRKE